MAQEADMGVGLVPWATVVCGRSAQRHPWSAHRSGCRVSSS